ncbi:MAG: response regulator [Dehalococcoidia bacterium]
MAIKILLVDDDPDFVAATKMVLEKSKYEVIVAGEGEEGIKKAKETKPDLIILDVIMPVKDGFTTAEQLKKDPQLCKIPIIMLTSYSEQKQKGKTNIPVSRGMTLEAEDYVEKPVKPQELLRRVEALLSKG